MQIADFVQFDILLKTGKKYNRIASVSGASQSQQKLEASIEPLSDQQCSQKSLSRTSINY